MAPSGQWLARSRLAVTTAASHGRRQRRRAGITRARARARQWRTRPPGTGARSLLQPPLPGRLDLLPLLLREAGEILVHRIEDELLLLLAGLRPILGARLFLRLGGGLRGRRPLLAPLLACLDHGRDVAGQEVLQRLEAVHLLALQEADQP